MRFRFPSSGFARAIATTLIVGLLFPPQASYANLTEQPALKPVAIPPVPQAQWPFPCTANPCPAGQVPHWFYLQNVASMNPGPPLVMTVTTSPQAAQHNQSPPMEPPVTVGISGTGVTLQPINLTPGGDNQMWYAIEANSGQANPSYLVSSLPADFLPVASDFALITQQLALGYFGSPGASSSVQSVSSQQLTLNANSPQNIFGTVALASNPFTLGQTVAINANPAPANGYWTIQQTGSNSIVYTIPNEQPYTAYSSSAGGNATAMAAVYLNQQTTNPAYLNATYTSAFQQWTYDSSDQTICNGLGACLNSADSSPHAGSIVTASSKPSPVPPSFQWSFYPNYQFSQILAQTNIPFPALKPADAKKINKRMVKLGYADAANATCNLDGVAYKGLRCEYSNLGAPLSTYLAALSQMKNVSAATRAQLSLELTDAIAVQNLFNQVTSVFNTVFLGNQDLISQDLGDMGMEITDQTSKTTWSWVTLLTGLLYTVINLAGSLFAQPQLGGWVKSSIVGAALANVMSTGVDTYVQAGSSLPFANEFATTAADLYTNFYSRLLNFYANIGDQETTILTDWGKLALAGAMAQDTGPNGLAWDPRVSAEVVAIATQAYQVNIMAQMLPQFFTLWVAMDWVGGNISSSNPANTLNSSTTGLVSSDAQGGAPSPMPTPNATLSPVPPQLLNQFSTPVDPQGSQNGMWDAGWLRIGANPGNGSKLADTYLTPQLAQDVQFANPYLLYNGMGLWSGFNVGPNNIANFTCDGAIVTMSNYTPKALTVTAQASNNTYVGGGYGTSYGTDPDANHSTFADLSDNSGVAGTVFRTLPPYGLLQFAFTAGKTVQVLTVQIWDYAQSTNQAVVLFTLKNGGCGLGDNQLTGPYYLTTSNGYSVVFPGVYTYVGPGKVSLGVYGGPS